MAGPRPRRKAVAESPAGFVNAFIGSATPPDPGDLKRTLGCAHAAWQSLVRELLDAGLADSHEWHCYSKKAGWSLRMRLAERTIVYLAPAVGTFRASFALGEKALQAATESGLPPLVMATIADARTYAEGTAVRVAVATPSDAEAVVKLARAKARG